MVGSFESLWWRSSTRFSVPPRVSISATKRSVVTRTVSPFAVGSAPGTLAVAGAPGAAGLPAVSGAAGFAGAGTPCAAGAGGASLGRPCLSHASHSISSEKLKMKSRISLWMSIFTLRHRVVAAGMPWAATADAPSTHQAAAPGAVAGERFVRVVRAARMETAGSRQNRAQAALVRPHHAKQEARAHAQLNVAKMSRRRAIIRDE